MKGNEHRHIAIVCNPKSGKGLPLKLLPRYESFLSGEQFTYEVFLEQLPPHLNGFTDLIIMGGDGTLNYTLNHFKQISIPIGIIRCGTGNDFSDLIFRKQPEHAAFSTSVYGTPQPVDAGKCNDRYFLNGVGIGFDGWVVKRLLAKRFFKGKAAYYSTVIALLLFYKETKVRITTTQSSFATSLFMLSAANGRTYGGGFKVAPKAELNDGLLDLISVSKISLPKRLRYLPVIEKGNHLHLPFIRYEQTPQIRVESDQMLMAHLDGELIESSVFDITLLPQYLQVRL